ncbi:MAG: hydrogenase/urease maturation nickel metallochaperone HypA [bacterium]|nr:hydrogenase/urease maturation nickel metallochaperone HypA [bacterium]
MHEFGIAETILKTAVAEAEKHQAKKIVGISVKLGQLNYLKPETLQSAFEMVATKTIAAAAKIEVEEVPGIEITMTHLDIE